MRGRTCSFGDNSCQVNRAQVERDVVGLATGSEAFIEVLSSGGDRSATLPAQSAAEQSCAGVDAAMPARRTESDVVSIEGLPVAPWVPLMMYIIPFSANVFIAGSTGTWLAEFGLHRVRPSWEPGDIDVFMIHTEPEQFEARIAAIAAELALWSGDAWPIRARVFRKHPHMFNIYWWVSGLPCPTLSFINCFRNVESSDAILNGFDIDICRVTVTKEAGALCVRLSSSVRLNIQHHVMHCVLNQGSLITEMLYPMARSLDRIEKYSDRGYRLQSLTFQSVQGGRLRIDRCIMAVSWDVMGQPPEEDGDASHPLPPPPPIEWQTRGAPHHHTCPPL